jgi:hypothetical protein
MERPASLRKQAIAGEIEFLRRTAGEIAGEFSKSFKRSEN